MKHPSNETSSHRIEEDEPLSDFDHPDLVDLFDAIDLKPGYVEVDIMSPESIPSKEQTLAEIPVASSKRLSHLTVLEQIKRAHGTNGERGTK